MKLTTTFSLITCLAVGQAFSQGFGTTPTNWPIPQGGHTYSTINYGFDAVAGTDDGELGDQTWSVLDINGDGKPDLVVTAQNVEFEQFSNQAIAFGSGSNRYWKVYLNNGNGFSANSINWPIPQGGHTYSTIDYGFDALADTAGGTLGDQTWSVLDMNNDNKPDLVVTAETVEFAQFSNQAIAFGTGSNRYWKVYMNTGSGFNTTAVNWPIPQGGHTYSTINYGFDALADTAGSTLGDQTWSVMDINADGKPDLVVTAQSTEFAQFSNQPIAFGSGSNRYWKVYLNTGSGFNTTSVNWPIPQGGEVYSTIPYGFNAIAGYSSGGTIGDQTWSVLDMNNDDKPDLVVAAEVKAVAGFSNQSTAFGPANAKYWKVYLNNGSGFSTTSTTWALPQGGEVYSTIDYGFNAIAASTTGGDVGNQSWSVIDMNNDNKPDLVVTAESKSLPGFSNQATAFGPANAKYWKVYINNGTGFNLGASAWALPQGGEVYSTIDYGYNALAASTTGGDVGNQTWSVLDMNNDNKPDLVVTAESVDFEQFSNQAIAFGTGNNRYWKVYLNSGAGVLDAPEFAVGQDEVTVYPNPSEGVFYVNTPPGAQASFEVNDLTGRTILKTESSTIDLSAFPTGMYILNVRAGQQSYVKRLILK
ncbi:Por secretion system C-terminal sorting domain-containing protein [Flavobacterium longum]|uniref:T9SS type A sorting domain-containing protein n=1 Tax=Flavobacterium longum TaxID=1299340 RepID=UPI0039E96D24